MRKWPLLLLACLLTPVFLPAQQLNVDSLVRELNKAGEDTNAVILCRILAGTIRNSDPVKAIAYAKQGIALGKKLSFDKGVAGCYLNLTAAYSSAFKIDSALVFIDSAIAWSHKAGDPNRLALAYLNRADFNMQVKNLRQSLRDCDTALLYAERSGNNDRRARILQTIGSIYFHQDKYPESREYYNRAINLYRKDNNQFMSAIVLNNIGNIYKRTLNYDSAVMVFREAIVIGDSLGDLVNLAMYYSNLGSVYTEMGQLDLAEEAATSSLRYAKERKNSLQAAIAYNIFSQIYLKQKKYPNALSAAHQAYEAGKEEADLEIQYDAADLLAETYFSMGEFREAYKYRELSKDLNDSLNIKKYNEDVASLQTSFRLEEKNQEIQLLNKEKELADQRLSRQRVMIIGSIALVILSLFSITMLVNRHRLRQRMKELQLRQQIAADLHDEVGSSLSSIHMLSQMAVGDHTLSSKPKEIMTRVSNYTRETMDKMGDILWMIKPSDQEWLGLKERMQRFLYEICDSRQLACHFECDDLARTRLNMQQRKALYLVFKEAVNNAAKYSGAKQIDVRVTGENGLLRLEVKDDGMGFDLAGHVKGNGLENMRNRAAELGGQTLITSGKDKGTTVLFTIPVG